MTEIIFDGTAVAAGASESGTHNVPDGHRGFDWTYYLNGDGNSTDLDVQWAVKPVGGDEFYPLDGGLAQTVDASENKAFEVDFGAADEVEVTITNNASSSTTISMDGDPSFR